MNKDTELLPCPFCGCKDIKYWSVKHDDGKILHTIRCTHCHEGLDGHPSKMSAHDRWNTRPNTPQSSEVDVDSLKKDVHVAHLKETFKDSPEDFQDYMNRGEYSWAYGGEYCVNWAIDYLSEQGYLKTPAENVRCDGVLEAYLEHIEYCVENNATGHDKDIAFDGVKKIRAALSQPKSEWLPIETAPKDGSAILVYIKSPITNDEWCDVVNYNDNYSMFMAGNTTVGHDFITHWMPLPTPPQKGGDDAINNQN